MHVMPRAAPCWREREYRALSNQDRNSFFISLTLRLILARLVQERARCYLTIKLTRNRGAQDRHLPANHRRLTDP